MQYLSLSFGPGGRATGRSPLRISCVSWFKSIFHDKRKIYLFENTKIIKTIKNQEFFLKLVYLNAINISIPVPYFPIMCCTENYGQKILGLQPGTSLIRHGS